MTLADILTLSKAGFTAQQITAMSQPQQAPQQAPYVQPQQAPQQVPYVQPQRVPQQAAQQLPYVQPVQSQPGTGYVPVLPQGAPADPMKDVMLQNYMNMPGANMYDVHDVVADMIGANAPVQITPQTGGSK